MPRGDQCAFVIMFWFNVYFLYYWSYRGSIVVDGSVQFFDHSEKVGKKKKKKPLQQTLELFQILNGCKQSVYKFIELSCGLFYTLKMTVVQRESDRTDAQRE